MTRPGSFAPGSISLRGSDLESADPAEIRDLTRSPLFVVRFRFLVVRPGPSVRSSSPASVRHRRERDPQRALLGVEQDLVRVHRPHDRVEQAVAGAVREQLAPGRVGERDERVAARREAGQLQLADHEVGGPEGEARLLAAARDRHRRVARARLPLEDPPVLFRALRQAGGVEDRRAHRAERRVLRPHAHAPEVPRRPERGERRVGLGHRGEKVAHLRALQR